MTTKLVRPDKTGKSIVGAVSRLLPFFIGLGVAYVVAINVVHLDKPLKFLAVFGVVLGLGYLFTWMNKRRIRKVIGSRTLAVAYAGSAQQGPPQRFSEKYYPYAGHILLLLAATAVGYGFAFKSNLVLLLGGGCWWFAEDLLIKAWQKAGYP